MQVPQDIAHRSVALLDMMQLGGSHRATQRMRRHSGRRGAGQTLARAYVHASTIWRTERQPLQACRQPVQIEVLMMAEVL